MTASTCASLDCSAKLSTPRALSIAHSVTATALPSAAFRLSVTFASASCFSMVLISAGAEIRKSDSPPCCAASVFRGIGKVSMALRSGSVNDLRTTLHQVVQVFQPRLGELPDLGIVDQD